MRFLQRLVDELLADGAVLRAEDDRDRLRRRRSTPAPSAESDSDFAGGRTFVERDRPVAAGSCSTGDFGAAPRACARRTTVRLALPTPESSMPSPSQSTGVGIVASTTNGPVTRVMLVVDLGPVDEHFLGRRLVVGDAT